MSELWKMNPTALPQVYAEKQKCRLKSVDSVSMMTGSPTAVEPQFKGLWLSSHLRTGVQQQRRRQFSKTIDLSTTGVIRVDVPGAPVSPSRGPDSEQLRKRGE